MPFILILAMIGGFLCALVFAVAIYLRATLMLLEYAPEIISHAFMRRRQRNLT